MEISVSLAPGRHVVERARLAEELGFKRCWLYDSPALYDDIWVALARVAEATQDIGLGTAVLVPSLRHVLVTAAAIATIEDLAPGRLAVAIGTGFTGRMMLGQKAMPWKDVASYVRNLRGLLHGEIVEVDGRAVQLVHPEGYGAARPLDTPILIAANGPKGLAVTHELGDGIMCLGAPQKGFDWCALLAMGTVLEPGETLETPRVFEALGPSIAVLYHGTWEINPDALDTLPGGKAWREEIEKLPEAERHLHVHRDHFVALNELDRRHVSPLLGGASFTGTAEELRERILRTEAEGCTELLYAPLGPDIPREMRAMAKAAGL